MDIGLVMGPRNHPAHPYPLADVYQDYIDDVVRAERLGFDNAWVGEHRMTTDQWTPSPLTVLANMAARTSEIRLGTSVMCLPFHNPLRLAEDVVAVDILSRGRFNFGFGVGSQFEEFRTFEINSKERLGRTYESAAFIQKALGTDEEFDWEGKYYTFPKVRFTTRPVQEEIPFYASAMGPQSVGIAASRGYNLIAEAKDSWVEGLQNAGFDPATKKAQTLLPIVVANTTEEAWDVGLEGLLFHLNFYTLRKRLDGSTPDPAEATLTKQDIIDGRMAAVGTPDEVLEWISEFYAGLSPNQTGVAFQMRSAGMTTPAVTTSMELFAEHVVPELRKL
ncbi:LLM class flavin-dependent oxidoreductase [Subtercola sp. YIM 133946]|uniref:LLM class flavin-dependent oxidoreductase n=1 Tax=Subtercola sp. YIM 133946 TaxID=3118909 RepID=UPI002F945DD2